MKLTTVMLHQTLMVLLLLSEISNEVTKNAVPLPNPDIDNH